MRDVGSDKYREIFRVNAFEALYVMRLDRQRGKLLAASNRGRDKVSVVELFAPALIVAPPARLTVTVPLPTVSCVVARLPSTSLTLTPPSASAVSSVTVCAPGTTFTGASLTLVTVIATVSVSATALLSVDTTVSRSAPLKFRLPW